MRCVSWCGRCCATSCPGCAGPAGPAAQPPLAARPGPPAVPPATPPTSEPGPPRPAGGAGADGQARAEGYPAASRPGVALQPVRLATDEELHEFVRHILALADNPKRRRDLLSGRLRFTLAPAGRGTPGPGPLTRGSAAPGPAEHRVEKGAVTERAVQAAAAAGARLVLGPRAVLTPLARDRARALGVPIEKER